MSNLTWLLSVGATAAIIELLWWFGITAFVIKYRKGEAIAPCTCPHEDMIAPLDEVSK